MAVETHSPEGLFEPIGPYSHVARAGEWVFVSGTPGVDPRTGQLAGPDAAAQARQVLANLQALLASAGCGLRDVAHVNVYLRRVEDFAAMNQAYAAAFGSHRPARTVVAVADLPKAGALLTMSLTAWAPSATPAIPRAGTPRTTRRPRSAR